jgi:Mor family transcriptional regulator
MSAALQRLKDEVGQDTYKKVLEVLAGETVYFPTGGTKEDNCRRNEKIKQDYYNRSVSYQELAKEYGLSVSQISKIVCSVAK